ncbi:MAG: fimbrillin family protein, partial [Rikenellaceae bacterium]
MKKLLHILLSAFVVSACSQVDITTNGGSLSENGDSSQVGSATIGFWEELSSYGNSTRGLVVENGFDVGAVFGVSAFELSDGIWNSTLDNPDATELPSKLYNMNVTLQSDDTWVYAPAASWPEGEDAKLRFFAYYPYDADGFASGESDGGFPTIAVPVVSNTPDEQVDFMVASTGLLDNSTSNSVVLSFEHVLTQVDFSLNYVTVTADDQFIDCSDWDIKLYEIGLSGVGLHTGLGRFCEDGIGFMWDYDADPTSVEYRLSAFDGHLVEELTYADAVTPNYARATTVDGVLLLQPQELSDSQVTVEFIFSVDKNDGEELGYYTQAVVASAHEYVMGKRIVYQYTLNPLVADEYEILTDGKLDVDVSDWEDGDDKNTNDTTLGTDSTTGDTDINGGDWNNGGGNNNDFTGGSVDGNVGDLEGGDDWDDNENDTELGSGSTDGNVGGAEGEEGWEGDNENPDTSLGSDSTDGDTDVDGGDWNNGGGNNNDFTGGTVDGNVGGVDGEDGWEGDNEDPDTNLGSDSADGDTDINGGDWNNGGGNNNDFTGGTVDGNVGGVDGEDGWDDNGNDTELGSGSIDGNVGGTEGEEGWEGDNENPDTNLGSDSTSGQTDVDGNDWENGGGNNNDFTGGTVDGNVGGTEGEDNWEADNKDPDTNLGSDSVDGQTDANGDDWNDGGGNNNDFTGGTVDGNV